MNSCSSCLTIVHNTVASTIGYQDQPPTPQTAQCLTAPLPVAMDAIEQANVFTKSPKEAYALLPQKDKDLFKKLTNEYSLLGNGSLFQYAFAKIASLPVKPEYNDVSGELLINTLMNYCVSDFIYYLDWALKIVTDLEMQQSIPLKNVPAKYPYTWKILDKVFQELTHRDKILNEEGQALLDLLVRLANDSNLRILLITPISKYGQFKKLNKTSHQALNCNGRHLVRMLDVLMGAIGLSQDPKLKESFKSCFDPIPETDEALATIIDRLLLYMKEIGSLVYKECDREFTDRFREFILHVLSKRLKLLIILRGKEAENHSREIVKEMNNFTSYSQILAQTLENDKLGKESDIQWISRLSKVSFEGIKPENISKIMQGTSSGLNLLTVLYCMAMNLEHTTSYNLLKDVLLILEKEISNSLSPEVILLVKSNLNLFSACVRLLHLTGRKTSTETKAYLRKIHNIMHKLDFPPDTQASPSPTSTSTTSISSSSNATFPNEGVSQSKKAKVKTRGMADPTRKPQLSLKLENDEGSSVESASIEETEVDWRDIKTAKHAISALGAAGFERRSGKGGHTVFNRIDQWMTLSVPQVAVPCSGRRDQLSVGVRRSIADAINLKPATHP